MDTSTIPADRVTALKRVATRLHERFQGVFGLETIEELLFDSYTKLAAHATVTRWLVVGAERFARERLDACVHAEQSSAERVPAVLFLCTHNAGRSQMALGWVRHLAGDRAVAWSGGSEPEAALDQAAVAAMNEVGIDIAGEFPKPWTREVISAADVVVTMGCGDSCPVVAGKHYEDWEVADPAGLALADIRPIRNELEQRVRELLARLKVEVTG